MQKATQQHRLVLSLYKSMLRQASLLQQNKSNTMIQIRTAFRQNKHVQQQEDVEKKIMDAYNRLSYLKMVTPRTRNDATQSEQYLIIDGKLVHKNAIPPEQLVRNKAVSNWTAGNVDPDHMRRHEQLLRRMQFKEGPLKGMYLQNMHRLKRKRI